MAVPGAIFGSRIGPSRFLVSAAAGQTTYAMAALNVGWAARFTAQSTKDIKSVKLRWTAVTAAGVVRMRIETIDATTGKPSGTLYDASATFDITPVVGNQTYTFASLPTAGFTVGTEYAIVLLTTTGGTTQTLNSHILPATNPNALPNGVLTAADGTTRTNFAGISGSIPLVSLILEDDTEEDFGFAPYTILTANNIFTTNAIAQKVVLAVPVVVAGIQIEDGVIVGTPAGDLRVRIFDSSDGTVSGTDRTLDKDSMTGFGSGRGATVRFAAPVTLLAGTYRIVLSSAASANSSNCYQVRSVGFFSSGSVPSAFRLSTTTDITAGPIVWADSTTDMIPISLVLDSIPLLTASAMLVHPGMSGGMRG